MPLLTSHFIFIYVDQSYTNNMGFLQMDKPVGCLG